MRFILLVLFLVVATFGTTGATFATSKVKDLPSTNQLVAAPNRFLRTSDLEGAHDQESRGFSFSGLSSMSEKTPKVTGMAKLWQQIQGKSANAAFALLRVDKADDLFSSKRFSFWAKYMTLVNRKDPEGAMLAILLARYGEQGLAKMLEAAWKAPGATAIVKNLRLNLLQKMKPVSVNNIAKPSNVDDALKKIPVSPSVVKVDDAAPVNPPNLNKLDDEADDLFAGMTVHRRDDILRLNPNVINRAEDVEVPASPNVLKIEENPTVVGNDFVARYNALLRMDRADDVKIPAGPNRVNDRVNDVPGGGISMVASNFNPNGLKPRTSSNLNKIDEGVEDLPAELSFNGFVRPQTP